MKVFTMTMEILPEPSSNKLYDSHKDRHGGNVTISWVYYVEGLGKNLFSMGQFCDSNLEVAFRKHTCYVQNFEEADLLSGSRDTNLYTISLDDMLKSSPIPASQLITPGTLSSGLVPNPPSSTPYVPSTNNDWDILFQPMFDEFFNPPPSVVSPVPTAVGRRPADLTNSPMSNSLAQDEPSASTSSNLEQEHSLVISKSVEEQLQSAQFDNTPFQDTPLRESYFNVQSSHTPFELLGKCTKNHLLENMIGDPSRSVSTRKQLKTGAMWCYFDAFLTSVEPKNFKEAMIESSWSEAM
ncbi:hypothetical protein Tco_0009033 [Tanacetum coccineum]